MLNEGLRANQGVVAPVGAVAELDGRQTSREERPVKPVGELLDTRERRACPDDYRRGLEDADALVALHEAHHAGDGPAFHETVGIEDHEVAEVFSPTTHEVRDVATFVFQVDAPAAVVNATVGAE